MEYSNTQQRIAAIGYRPVLNKSTFVVALAVFGVFSMVAAIVSITSALVLLSNATLPNPFSSVWIEIVYQLGLGALILTSAWVFAKGKFLSVWLYGASLAIDSLFHLMMGNPLNYLFVGFGFLILWQILKYRRELELL